MPKDLVEWNIRCTFAAENNDTNGILMLGFPKTKISFQLKKTTATIASSALRAHHTAAWMIVYSML